MFHAFSQPWPQKPSNRSLLSQLCEIPTLVLKVQSLFFTSSDAQLLFGIAALGSSCTFHGNIQSLELISEVAKQPLPLLVKEFLCQYLRCALQFIAMERMMKVSIVSFLLSLTTSSSYAEMPFFLDETVIICVQTIVDGFIEINNRPLNVCVVDEVNIFRPDRVFKFLLEMHYQILAAIHPRHKCHKLSSIAVLIRIIGQRVVTSSTSNYIFSILGHYIGIQHLQDQCCNIISTMLDIFKADSATETILVFGEQLQEKVPLPSQIIKLLSQLTVDADPLLYDFIKDLEPFPPLECLERVRIFHEDLCRTYSTKGSVFDVRPFKPSSSKGTTVIESLHEKLLMNDIIPHNRDVLEREWNNGWNCDSDIVNAVWNLFQLINTDDANDICGMLSDFVARIGIGDPYQVVFRLPDSSKHMHVYPSSFFFNSKETTCCPDVGVSDDLLLDLLQLLKKYLVDDSVKTVDITVQTLQGILSTEKGQGALLALNSYERSVIEVHSKGVNLSLLEELLLDIEKKHTSIDVELDDSSIWSTMGKSYEIWICLLVHKIAGLCDDVILRLCREIVLLKSEVANLLFSSVLVNLAWNDDSNGHMRELISVKIRDNIFVESNGLAKSIQVVLDALNRLRSFYVADCAASCFTTRQKSNRISSVSRSRYPSEKSKGRTSDMSMLCSFWPKVYWLSLDYLLVAKAAIHCGSYFTAILYIEHWCEERFNGLTLGAPDFSHMEELPTYIELLIAAFTQINEPDAIYGVIQSHKLTSQLALFEHEGNWSKALEYCDLLVRSVPVGETENFPGKSSTNEFLTYSTYGGRTTNWKYCKGLMRSLQNIGSRHVLDLYGRGLVSKIGDSEHDREFAELQYEAAWRAGNWDFSLFSPDVTYCSGPSARGISFNENLHSCLRALQEGDFDHFHLKLVDTKKELVLSISNASWEAAEYIHSNISKLQILHHLGMAWELRWKSSSSKQDSSLKHVKKFSGPVIPLKEQLEWMNIEWNFILRQAQLQMKLLEPVIAFRRVMLQILDCKEFLSEDLLQAASTLRKGLRYSLATAALHELKFLFCQTDQERKSRTYTFGRLEEAKILRAQGQPDMAINLAKYLLQNYQMEEEASNIYRLIGKWLAETRSSNSRTILEKYLKRSVELLETGGSKDQKYISRQCQTFFQLAHYTDSLFKNYEERLASNEWQAALRLRKHKTKELEVLIRRMKSSTKAKRTDYSVKIQELQKQLSMDREEAERLQDDRDNFLNLALEGYKRCLVIGGKYDLRVVFRIVSLWFSLHMRHNVVESMSSTAMEVQSYKFLPLVYQIASRLGISKEGEELISFQNALLFLVRKMAIEHPYHTIFQILALANGDRIKDKQRNKNSFVVDMDKKLAAENLLSELSSSHGGIIQQMKQMVEIYIKLAELETKKEDTNKKVPLPREIRSIRQLELVPVVTANIAIDPTSQYKEGTFPHFKGLGDSVKIMNGINVPKVVECFGSDGQIYRQLAKSGNDDLRQDAVMEQFFGIVNIFLQHHRDTWKRKLQIRTYKVVPFTPSAGLVEWVDRTIPLGEYLLGSSRNGGAHGRYGGETGHFFSAGSLWLIPVMRYFFLERFLRPADWFERRLAYTRSVAASSMVGYIVGLGDRHSMNILIDEATAEVIHIDLGVAFEQGLMLKTPERVPFRLTRDIVDGMGVTGVEGVFRRCCEETLSVMRTNKEALLTIIEVFIHDPLYKWALSPLKALQRQKETNYDSDSSLESSEEACEGNRDAARAILRVKQKLDGYEDGEMRSVAGQVQQLIQDAIDTDRLSQMFPGWGAWL
ncbi:hypothetical protein HPP92_004868 [Vanilla planifolia]|uniref:Serine/threonine-protein kinase ATM n=1 Tax=Vanilla planifolia TaxID=51239 RepID=A0A835VC29_VANPL|nr:hypothetical protein HPP92_004868 [Vanilla planifolia]